MVVTRSSADKTKCHIAKTTKSKNNKQKKSNSCSSSALKRTKSPGVRLIGGRIYDSVNGKTCHQCRQKTMNFSVTCKNCTESKIYCHICLLNRYGEKAEEAAALGCQWKCPKCRGVCNCCRCMKGRGFKPTGILFHIAKSKGFSSVSEMLCLEDYRSVKEQEDASLKRGAAFSELGVTLPRKRRKENRVNRGPFSKEPLTASAKRGKITNLDEKYDQGNQSKPFEMKSNGKETISNMSSARKAGGADNFVEGKKKCDPPMETVRTVSSDMNKKKERVDERAPCGQLKVTKNFSAESRDEAKGDREEPNNEFRRSAKAGHVAVEDVEQSIEITTGFLTKNSEVEIPLPQGTQLTQIANLELPAEDIGHALQFLEFCEAFGQVLDLRKGQSESLLRDLVSGQISRRRRDLSVDGFHIKLLSVIMKDSGKGYSSLKTRDRNSWLEALQKQITESRYISKDLMLDSSSWGNDGYEKLNSSKKLRILTFLCDEALSTAELRSWIHEQNSEFAEEVKKAKEKALAEKEKEKIVRKKLQDEVAGAILQTNRAPLSILEHEELVLKIKTEVTQSLSEKLEATQTRLKMKRQSDAVRSDPVLSDVNGCKFWKLRSCYSEMDILLQDIGYGDLVTCQERWFFYDIQEKAIVERYLSRHLRR